MKGQKDLQKTVEEQNKIIAFLKQQYHNETGHQAIIPKQIRKQIATPIVDVDKNRTPLFMDIIIQNELPQPIDDPNQSSSKNDDKQQRMKHRTNKNREQQTTMDIKNPSHLIQKIKITDSPLPPISLSYLLLCISEMPCLMIIDFSKSNIHGSSQQLNQMFKKYRRINLRDNQIDWKGLQGIVEGIEQNEHLEWIDIRNNNYINQGNQNQSQQYKVMDRLMKVLDNQFGLIHFGIDSNKNTCQYVCRLLRQPNIRSANIDNTNLSDSSTLQLYKSQQTNPNLSSLSLQSSYPSLKVLQNITHYQLIHLNLSHNNISSSMINPLIDNLYNNQYLQQLDMSYNRIDSHAVCNLMQMLEHNVIISLIDLSHNQLDQTTGDIIFQTIQNKSNVTIKVEGSGVGIGLQYQIQSINNQDQYVLLQGIEITNQITSHHYKFQRNLVLRTISKSMNMNMKVNLTVTNSMKEQSDHNKDQNDYCFNELQEQISGYNPLKHDILLTGSDYEQNINPNIERLKQLGFNQQQISKMFKKSPRSFVNIKLDRSYRIEQGIEVLEQSIQQSGLIDNQNERLEFIKKLIMINPKSMQMSSEQWNVTIQALRILDLVNRYPKVVSEQLVYQIKSLSRLIKLYLDINNDQFNQLFIKYPFILTIPQNQVIENIKQLLNWGFEQEQIYEILIDNSQILSYKQTAIQVIKDNLIQYFQLKPKCFRRVVMENKQLLVMCAQNLLKPKYQLMESFGIDQYLQVYIMKTCPRIYVKSENSTYNKLKYLQKRWSITDLQNYDQLVYYLNFNYVLQIRPRGEAMLQKQQIRSWIDVLELSDSEFCSEIGISEYEFKTILNQLKPNNEEDHKKRFYSDLIKSDGWSQH